MHFILTSMDYRGSELLQRGRGFGGFFRSALSGLRAALPTIGRTLAKAATSDTAKKLGAQALDSVANITKDVLQGNDLKDSMDREAAAFRETGANMISEMQDRRKRKETSPYPGEQKEKNKSKRKQTKLPKKVKPSLQTMRRYGGRY